MNDLLEEVIFDTNFLYNKKATSFFKNRGDLEKFFKVSKIIIPDIVISELEEKYKRSLGDEIGKFVKTILDSFLTHDASNLSVEEKITDLKKIETISYDIIYLTDFSVIERIKELALKKLPPFEPGNNTDKGFKDAYIYFTILEYLNKSKKEKVFFCTKDHLLKKAFQNNTQVIVIEDYEEFILNSISRFTDDYFIRQLSHALEMNLEKRNIKDFWLNIEGNYVVVLSKDETEFLVEIDFTSRELIDQDDKNYFYNSDEIDDLVNNLINSGSFAFTHTAVENLSNFKNFLSDEQITNIFTAITENTQIISDEDVQQFIHDIFEPRKEIINPDLKLEIMKFLNSN